MCRADPIFFINVFGYIFEPRTGETMPWVTYPFQDDFIGEAVAALGNYDITVPKSRAQGASWLVVAIFDWACEFHDMQTFLMLSRKEELVDKKGDPKSLFWKLDFMRERRPGWLNSPVDRRSMHIEYLRTGSVVDGESTNKFAGVADRRMAILFDEFSKMPEQDAIFAGTADVSNCRFFVFTPQGSANTAYRIAHKPEMRVVPLHWSNHPVLSEGLYRVDQGSVTVLDEEFYRHRRYQFRADEPENANYKYRSPWYDYRCDRAAHPREIAQELDIDFMGSDVSFFPPDLINRVIREQGRDPIRRGRLEFDPATFRAERFSEDPHGPLELWFKPDTEGNPPRDTRYCIGGDIASGSSGVQSSNSCLAVWDRNRRMKVAAYTVRGVLPHRLAQAAMALGWWFCSGREDPEPALIIWEINGPGKAFETGLVESDYPNMYFRQDEKGTHYKKLDRRGWANTVETKLALFSEYRRFLVDGLVEQPDRESMEEARNFVWLADNSVDNKLARSETDFSASGYNHGDRTTSDALACKALEEIAFLEAKEEVVIPQQCFYARRQRWEEKVEELSAW
jgi:hypothetical protein